MYHYIIEVLCNLVNKSVTHFWHALFVLLMYQDTIQKEDRLTENILDNSLLLNDFSEAVSREKNHGNGELITNHNDHDACQRLKTEVSESHEMSDLPDKDRSALNGNSSLLPNSVLPDSAEMKGLKRSHENEELDVDNKRSRTVIIDSDDETHEVGNVSDFAGSAGTKIEGQSVLQENEGNIVGAGFHSSKHLNGNFTCTACNKVAIEVHCHPLLKVIICGDCKCLIERKMRVKVWTVVSIVNNLAI